jgi:hypothetical protein
MKPLFYSYVCDICDPPKGITPEWSVGYVAIASEFSVGYGKEFMVSTVTREPPLFSSYLERIVKVSAPFPLKYDQREYVYNITMDASKVTSPPTFDSEHALPYVLYELTEY